LIADSMRTMRYNYRNQLRTVHRKSDGALLSQYRSDGLGRPVWNERHWYLGRMETLDTRFPTDIDLDADGDGVEMTLTDGGMAAFDPSSAPNELDEASWSGRLKGKYYQKYTHCFDYFVYVPTDVQGWTDG